MRIDVTDIFLIGKDEQFEVYAHPKDKRGYVINGLVKIMKKIAADNPIKRYSQ